MTNASKKGYAAAYETCSKEMDLAYRLTVFGHQLAKREGYKTLEGMEAIHFYLCHKFRWTPTQVRAIQNNDLALLLSEEMHGWTPPPEALC